MTFLKSSFKYVTFLKSKHKNCYYCSIETYVDIFKIGGPKIGNVCVISTHFFSVSFWAFYMGESIFFFLGELHNDTKANVTF